MAATAHHGPGGIDRYGVSAPAPDAYDFFGLTPDAIAARVLDTLKQRDMR